MLRQYDGQYECVDRLKIDIKKEYQATKDNFETVMDNFFIEGTNKLKEEYMSKAISKEVESMDALNLIIATYFSNFFKFNFYIPKEIEEIFFKICIR